MEQTDPRYLLVKIAKILQKLKIPYMITGGMAVFVWGRPRFTADIDIIVELTLEDIEKLVPALSLLGEAGYIDEIAAKDALKNHGEFNFIDGQSGVKVDFWVLKQDLYTRSQFKRCVPKIVLGHKVLFISPEDLILSKLQWYLKTKSSRQLEDVESIFKISGEKLDLKYLKTWAVKLKTASLLKKFL